MSGAGAAGTAILKLLIAAGVKNAVVADIHGVVHADRADLVDAASDSPLRWIADNTNPEGLTGTLKEAVRGADVFIGVSAPNVLDGDDVAAMADGADVFALANPDPEVEPAIAARPRQLSPPAAPTSPTRSTTCWSSRASSAASWTPSPARSTPR